MKKFDVIMTISTAEPSILRYSLSSVFINAKYINNVVIAVEKSKSGTLTNILSEYELNSFKVIEAENNSTKLHKLKMASPYIDDENLVIILDEDDYLLNLENLLSLDGDYDLLITPFFKYQDNNLFEMSLNYEHNHIPVCSNKFSSFIDNFNSISKAWIFKEALTMVEYDFQKLEGVFRGLIYLQLCKKPLILKEHKYSFLIWTKFTGRNHMSSQVNIGLAVKWMKNLLNNLSKVNITSIEKGEINTILKSNLLRIYRTARIFYLENLINQDEMDIMNGIMKKYNINTTPSMIYNEEMLEVFDISLNKYKLGELI